MNYLVNSFRKIIGKPLRETILRITADQIDAIIVLHFLLNFRVSLLAKFRIIYRRILDLSLLLESEQFLRYDEYQETS